MQTSEIAQEIALVSTIIEKLLSSNHALEENELRPLVKRLRIAADNLSVIKNTTSACAEVQRRFPLQKEDTSSKGCPPVNYSDCGGSKKLLGVKSSNESKVISKVVTPLPRATAKKNNAAVLKEGSIIFASSLYNLLESVTTVLRATSGHIFVKKGDEMVSIANVATKLTFPPQLTRSRCLGNPDADVLSSGIALNRSVEEPGKLCALLIFPIYRSRKNSEGKGVPLATIHLERSGCAFQDFNRNDECVLYFASIFSGELMSRAPDVNWIDNFFDPVTQHAVAPFRVPIGTPLPVILGTTHRGSDESSALPTPAEQMEARRRSSLFRRVEDQPPEVLIRREALPAVNMKPFAAGMVPMPSLLEVQAYVENLCGCWQKNVTSNVDLLEADRDLQLEVKSLRKELITTRRLLSTATENLRLYELGTTDYTAEYKNMKLELDMYINGREALH